MKTAKQKPPKKTESQWARVAECLYRNRSSGTYYAWVKRGGKQIRKSLLTQDRKLAERALKEFREKAGLIDHKSDLRDVTFEGLGKKWLKIRFTRLKPSAAKRIGGCMDRLNEVFGRYRIRDINESACERWELKRSQEVSASTFNKEKEVLNGLFGYAIEKGLLIADPSRRVKRRKLSTKEILIPSRDQFTALVKQLRSMDVRYQNAADLVELLAVSGMRLGEATRIRWREVNFDQGSFTVSGGKAGTKNREIRFVPLFPSMRRLLEVFRAKREIEEEAELIPINDAKNALMSACRKANLPNFTHHSMRHFFVSNAIEAGIDFKTIAAWVGHKDGGLLVAKTYGHLRDSHSMEMAKLMDF